MTNQRLGLTLAPNGRIVIPAAMRAALGLKGGARLVARVEDGAIILEPIETSVRRSQALVAAYANAGAHMSDELIAERRAEAAGE
jgi:AbrB family looped-hinge helix DNA binding protein